MNWKALSFANPWLLCLLLLLPVIAMLQGRRGAAAAVKFSSLQLVERLGRPRRVRAGGILTTLLLASLAAFIIGLARPQAGSTISHVEASGIDIMLALDVSRSMLAEDPLQRDYDLSQGRAGQECVLHDRQQIVGAARRVFDPIQRGIDYAAILCLLVRDDTRDLLFNHFLIDALDLRADSAFFDHIFVDADDDFFARFPFELVAVSVLGDSCLHEAFIDCVHRAAVLVDLRNPVTRVAFQLIGE